MTIVGSGPASPGMDSGYGPAAVGMVERSQNPAELLFKFDLLLGGEAEFQAKCPTNFQDLLKHGTLPVLDVLTSYDSIAWKGLVLHRSTCVGGEEDKSSLLRSILVSWREVSEVWAKAAF